MKPALYFYCQHSVGMGHLVRSIAIARALSAAYDVHLLCGGQTPAGFDMPKGVAVHHLPALGMESAQLISLEPGRTVEDVKRARLAQLQRLLAHVPVDVLVTELFPFGRKKFAFELDLLISAAHRRRATVACSVRDLLVSARHDQQRHDDRAAAKLNDDYDAVIVHSDPAFARLEETFQPTTPLRTPVYYSGFVVPNPPRTDARTRDDRTRERRVVVSAGGGIVGGPLFRAAIDMHRACFARTGMPMTLVAGPFLPESEWQAIVQDSAGLDGLQLLRSTPDLCALMQGATHSVSQFGYNTAIDLMVSGAAAVVAPYAARQETEQTVRAERLAAAGRVTIVREHALSGTALANALNSAVAPETAGVYALNGASETLRILDSLRLGSNVRTSAER